MGDSRPREMVRGRSLYLYAVSYVIISSLQYSFTKNGLQYADPFTLMAARYLIASSAVFLYARRFKPSLDRDTILISLFTFTSTLLWILGLERVSPAQSAVFSYTMPLFAIPIAALVLNERATRLGWAGTILGFLGVVIYGLSFGGGGGTVLGAVLTVGNAFFWGLYSVLYRKTKKQDATSIVGTQLLVCGILFAVLAPVTFHVNVSPTLLLDLGYISIMGGFVLFLLWSGMLRLERVGRVTTMAFAVPAMTTLVEAIETGVTPTLVTIGGICIMFLGIYISRMQESTEVRAP